MKFTHYQQHDQMDCGPTCLRMVAKYYGQNHSLQRLRELCNINREGVSLLGISDAAEKLGFRTNGVKIDFEQLKDAELPCILHWRQNHFVVLFRIRKKKFYVADPAKGIIIYTNNEFINNWVSDSEYYNGIALLMSPTPVFYQEKGEKSTGISLSFILKYRYAYKNLIFQLILGLGIGSILQLITPFLTQSVVDIGINTKNINFVYVVLIAQIMLFLGNASVTFIRSWIMLHMTTRINVSILTDFLAKLMRLPMAFFDTRMTGDIMQRMSDHHRIEGFLTGSTLGTFFSLINLVVFGIALGYYNTQILFIFVVSTILYTGWILLFMKRRRVLDFKRFDNSSLDQSNIVELISGIQEIKLHNSEQRKRWQWERIQAKLFKFSVKSLALSQYQQAGSMLINQGKNILISFIGAKAVIDGNLTLGGMMAVQYMAGQLNSPIDQLLGLIQGFQDAKISLERLNEIHEMEDEEPVDRQWINEMPNERAITVSNLTFRYPGAGNEPVLKGIDLHIPEGKTTAIVGMSGSGKTTILKLLLRFYEPENGDIKVGNTRLDQLGFKIWRENCGTVMQDGFIFSDSIANNIAVSDEKPNKDRIMDAIKVANIQDYISSLPLGLNTKIGTGGNGTSMGQKQRLLIARAVYKDPAYIFFDEATNALDANNELTIMENLSEFFNGKTVVVVAHRLSTVKNADNIVVLDKGRIIEQGNHSDLIELKGQYYKLVKNQLEVSNLS